MSSETKVYEGKYHTFYWSKGFEISYQLCGYFDNRPRIVLHLFLFRFIINLPFPNNWIDECDPPTWGIAYHNQIFWIYRGGKGNMSGGNKWWTFNMPWSYDWVRTSALRADGCWEHDTKKTPKSFYQDIWKGILWEETHPYTYTLRSGKVQNRMAIIKVEEREWRMRWLKWVPIFRRISKDIKVDFNDEVGERSGSWKGGTVGCGYEMIGNETPLECLKRMQNEREFN